MNARAAVTCRPANESLAYLREQLQLLRPKLAPDDEIHLSAICLAIAVLEDQIIRRDAIVTDAAIGRGVAALRFMLGEELGSDLELRHMAEGVLRGAAEGLGG